MNYSTLAIIVVVMELIAVALTVREYKSNIVPLVAVVIGYIGLVVLIVGGPYCIR